MIEIHQGDFVAMTTMPEIKAFFDEPTNTVSYLVADPQTRQAAVIDPVLDYDHRSGKADVRSADTILKYAADQGFTIAWVLETHAHADHLSGAPYIKTNTGAKVAIGEHIKDVQRIFRPVFNVDDVSGDGSEFDKLLADGETLRIGNLVVEAIYTPGHTPACMPTRCSLAIRCSCRTTAPPAPISRAGMRVRSTGRSTSYWRCRRKRGCSCAMTTRRQAATIMRGKRRSAKSAPATCMSARA
jgi:hypothetical protein